MRDHGINAYPDVFKNTELLNVLPDAVVEELRRSAIVEFEEGTHNEIEYVVAKIIHKRQSTIIPNDIEHHILVSDNTQPQLG